MPNEGIKIVVDNKPVTGEILHHSSRDLDVRITKPYEGITKGVTIPIGATQSKTFEGEHGYQKAKELLEELYNLCQELVNNKENLKSALPDYEKEKTHLKQSQADLEKQKSDSKNQLKDGIINHQDYQKTITSLNKKIENLYDEIDELFEKYFQKHLSQTVPSSSRDEVIDFIKGM